MASLIYIAAWTRPDISYAVGLLAQQMHDPSDEAIIALKRLLRYVFITAEFCLVYDFSGQRKCGHDDFIMTHRSGTAPTRNGPRAGTA